MGKEKQWELEKDYDKREFYLTRIEGKTGYQFNNFQNVPDKDLEELYIWICNDGNPDYNDQYIESFEYRGMKKQSISLLDAINKLDKFLMNKNDKEWMDLTESEFGNTGFYGCDEDEEQECVSNFDDYSKNGGDLQWLYEQGLKIYKRKYKKRMKKQSQDEGPIDMISNDELDTAMDEGGEGLDDLGGGDLGGDIGGGMPGDMEGGPGGMEGPQAPMPVDDVDWDSMNIVWDEENDLDAKRRRGDDGLEIDYSRII